MTYEISVGPDQLTINVGECVLMTETDGHIRQPSERGLFFRDTRVVSVWRVTVNGQPWQSLSSAAVTHYAAQVVMTNPRLATDDGEIAPSTISLTLSRLLGGGGVRETLGLANYNRTPVRLTLLVEAGCDFADIFDVKSHRTVSRGETMTDWLPDEARLVTIHANGGFRRGLSIGPCANSPQPRLSGGGLCFVVDLAAQSSWTAELEYRLIDGTELLDAPQATFADRRDSKEADALGRWVSQATRLRTPNRSLQRLYDQSLEDLAALRLPIPGTDMHSFVPAAGIPWFAALFGRDSLITAIQTIPIYPKFALGALDVLGRHQASEVDDTRDMQPGKIPHELRHGELAELGLVPYRPYYGTADATPLYIILLHHVWRFTGDAGLVETHLQTAERCLEWIDNYGDLDGDGFQEYRRRTLAGAENQSWKDSGNAVLYENGDDVPAPKALCELQGYVYDAWRRMAGLYRALSRADRAAEMDRKADELYEHFNAVFWDEAAQAYALCLDPAKRRVMSNASNAGHLLWSGIVPPERAGAVVRRLMADDMWSGWGVRTLSSAHAAYNPHDYQLGAIWPHDNGFIALGLKHYGFHAEAARIAGGLIDAGSRFLLNRLPEVFAGTSRDVSPFPIQYLGANVPQAWAAGAVFSLLRAMLGIEVDAKAGILHVDPYLPAWLEELCLEGLHVCDQIVDLRFWREAATVRFEITRGTGIRLVRRDFSHVLRHD